ncbi:MAG: TetR/AcrR family transcriptional regulator [Desulfobacteraceae bacterium]|mgnify:CR=1 FL=1|nr:MAG: TetR/AcrR family transcriptional regulator [Desulfobacteraceae bacterium]
MYVNGEMMTELKKMTKAAQRKATMDKLIQIATREFAAKGYAAASTEHIVEQAGLTRGALYHHFKNKAGLFLAVFRTAQEEIGRRVESSANSTGDLWEQLTLGCRAFLEASSDPVLQQIVVIDGPAVLKWETVRQVDASLDDGSLSLLKECLAELVQSKTIIPVPVEAIAHLLSGAMDEAAVWIAQSKDPVTALEQAWESLNILLSSLKVDHQD